MKRHVIIGNGHAAISAVRAIRSLTQLDEIILISKENCPAYSPALTTYYLSGSIPYQEMFFCDQGFYQENRVETLLGKEVVRVAPGPRTVFLEDGSSVEYDDLLVATGSSPWIPPMDGVRLPRVFTLWTAEDARRIRDSVREAARVVVVGAGLVGIQIVDAMVRQNKQVILVEMLSQVLPRVLDSKGASILQERMAARGIELRLGERMLGIREQGGRMVLSLLSGHPVEGDMVLLATGAKPNVTLLEDSGVKISQGVVVDECCRTSLEGIYAAGDVAEVIDPITQRPQLAATLLNATQQGRVAGLNMAGGKAACFGNLRVNVFTCLGLPFASVGAIEAGEGGYQEVSHQKDGNYRRLVFKGDSLVGVVLAGDVEEAGILSGLVGRGEVRPNLRQELQRAGAAFLLVKAFHPALQASSWIGAPAR